MGVLGLGRGRVLPRGDQRVNSIHKGELGLGYRLTSRLGRGSSNNNRILIRGPWAEDTFEMGREGMTLGRRIAGVFEVWI